MPPAARVRAARGAAAREREARRHVRPFQHLLTVGDQLSCLARIRRHLAPTGRLVFDIFNPSIHRLARTPDGRETDAEPAFTLPDGRSVMRSTRMLEHDLIRQIVAGEFVYHVRSADGRRERLVHPFRMRYLFRFEAEHLLARAGFTVEQVYAGFDGAPCGATYPGELVFVAR